MKGELLHILRDEGFSKKLDVIKLRGSKNHYRIRVGKYRILFELEPDNTIIVYAILPREVAYQ
ncbi:MAG: type II toxin-antitoxin system RelE/ParE family toxin [Nitrososphaeria archaeon]